MCQWLAMACDFFPVCCRKGRSDAHRSLTSWGDGRSGDAITGSPASLLVIITQNDVNDDLGGGLEQNSKHLHALLSVKIQTIRWFAQGEDQVILQKENRPLTQRCA
jgi:hypothetical protein